MPKRTDITTDGLKSHIAEKAREEHLYAASGNKKLLFTYTGNYRVRYEGHLVLDTCDIDKAVSTYNQFAD